MTRRDRYALCFGVAFVSIATIAARGMPALAAWNAREQSVAVASSRELSLARTIVADMSAARDSLAMELHRVAELESRLVSGSTPADAASALAKLVSDIADRANLKISTIEPHDDSLPAASLRTVSVRLAGTTDVVGLTDFLLAIDTADTLMAVRELVVSQAEPAAPSTQAEALRVEVFVAALARLTPTSGR